MNRRRDLASLAAVAALALALALPAAADPPGAPWVTQVIGNPTIPGSIDVDASGVWTLTGATGVDFVNDRIHMAYQRLKGDGSISLRFLRMQFRVQDEPGYPGGAGSFGLEIRENDSARSPHLRYWMTSFGLLPAARFEQSRGIFDLGYTAGPIKGQQPNLWMRLQRVGNEITPFYSRDGLLWFQDGDPTPLPTLPEEAMFGFYVYVGGSRALTGTVDQVQIQSEATLVHGLRTRVRNQQVLLEWRPLKNALAYNIYRGPSGSGGIRRHQVERLNTDRVAGTFFTDDSPGLVNGTSLTYAVAAIFRGPDANPVEGPLAAVWATPAAIPPGWIGSSINEGVLNGSASYDGATGAITLHGHGNGFSNGGTPNAADKFYFLHQAVEDDVQITARLLTAPKGLGFIRKAGVIVRESLHAGARTVLLAVQPDPNSFPSGLVRQIRQVTDRQNTRAPVLARSRLQVPIVLRLTRQGNTVTSAYSMDDGKTFQAAGSPVTFDPPLGKTLFVGLASTGGSGFDPPVFVCEATFNGVRIEKP